MKRVFFQDFAQRLAGGQYQDLVCLTFTWDRVVGRAIKKRTRIEKFEKGVLFVSVVQSSWLTELKLMQSVLMEKLYKESSIKIKEIVFYIKGKKRLKWLGRK